MAILNAGLHPNNCSQATTTIAQPVIAGESMLSSAAKLCSETSTFRRCALSWLLQEGHIYEMLSIPTSRYWVT
jgi:hypothetical protein